MNRVLFALLALSLALPLYGQEGGSLDELENPIADAAEGEWTSYELVSENPMAGAMKGSLTMAVVGVDGTDVSVKNTVDMMGMQQEQVEVLDAEGAVADLITSIAGGGASFEVEESEVEDVEYEHDGETYAAKKITLKAAGEDPNMGMKIKVDMIVWMSYDIPVSGIMKSEADIMIQIPGQEGGMGAKVVQTLTGFGTEPVGEEPQEEEKPREETGDF